MTPRPAQAADENTLQLLRRGNDSGPAKEDTCGWSELLRKRSGTCGRLRCAVIPGLLAPPMALADLSGIAFLEKPGRLLVAVSLSCHARTRRRSRARSFGPPTYFAWK